MKNSYDSQTTLFKYPKLYDLIYSVPQKHIRKILSPIIDGYIKDKTVLEIGAGYKSYLFDEKICKKHVAFDINSSAMLKRKCGIVGDATKEINVKGKFDVVLITAMLHHTGKHDLVLQQAKKYSDTIIIFDSVRNHNLFLSAVQFFYFWILDKGNSYPSEMEWEGLIRSSHLKITYYKRFGWLFSHLIFLVLNKNQLK